MLLKLKSSRMLSGRMHTFRNFGKYSFSIKPTDALISKFILVRNSTCFGQRNCPKHVEFRTRINMEISASVGFIEKKFITMHGHINIKFGKYLPGDKMSHLKRLESSVQGILYLEVKDRKVTATSSNYNSEE